MKRLFTRGLLLSLAVLVTIQCVSIRIRDAGYDPYQPYEQHLKPLSNSRDDIRAISVGNSHAQAIEFKSLGINGYHLWLPAADFFEIDHLVRYAVPKMPNIEFVLINISYFSFRFDNAAIESRRIRRKWLYASMNRWQYIKGDRTEFITGKLNSWTGVDTVMSTKTEQVIKALIGQNISDPLPSRGPNGQRLYKPYIECQHQESHDVLVRESKSPVERHLRLEQNMQSAHPHLHEDTIETVDELLNYLSEKEIEVLLYTPPYFVEYTNQYEQSKIVDMQQVARNIAEIHQVQYLDYSVHPDFINDSKVFYNADHLNLCGARKFSQELASKINLGESKTYETERTP